MFVLSSDANMYYKIVQQAKGEYKSSYICCRLNVYMWHTVLCESVSL